LDGVASTVWAGRRYRISEIHWQPLTNGPSPTLLRGSIKQSRHHLIRQRVEELIHGSQVLSAPRAAGHNHAMPLRNARRLVNECIEVVPVDFGVNLGKQMRSEHAGSLIG
jgi:hypothetical protein